MNKKIELSGSDKFFFKLFAVLMHDLKIAIDSGFAYPDACEEAAAAVLARIRAQSGEGDLFLGWHDEDLSGITAEEAKIFAHGLVVGSFFERHGITFCQKATGKDLN